MISPIKYIASSGRTYDLTANGLLHRSANYYDWEWEAEGTTLQYGIRVSNFSRKPVEYDMELVIYGTPAHRRQILQSLHNDFENDMRNKKPGRLVWGNWYLDCYLTQSRTSPLERWTYLSNEVHVFAPYPFWMQDFHIELPASDIAQSRFLDFTYDFQYDYTSPVIGERHVQTDFPFESEFRLIIFGQAVNPRIVINGYVYALLTTIPSGAYAIVDSRAHTIMMYNANGTRTNIFNFRNKTDSIFRKIPGGNLDIAWDASFGANITIYQEKSEPDFEEVVK